MEELISNTRLATFLRRQISLEYNTIPQLDNIKLCGSRAVNPSQPIAVKIIANEKQSKFTSVANCHSTWSCPYCTAKEMAKKSGDIGCAIDALATWFKLRPMMITFTLPHISTMSCEEIYTILLKTWRRFTKDGNKITTREYTLKTTVGKTRNKSYGPDYKTKTSKGAGTKNKYDQRAVGTAGETKQYKVYTSKWANFRDELDIKHSVRVYEFTWGENSWHPHIHALFWTHENNFKKIPEHEPALLDYWWKCAKSEALKMYNKKNPDQKEENKKFVEDLFSQWRKEPNGPHRSLFISKDENGAIRKISSSRYICGWGGEKELTGMHEKHAKKGHYTPFQMLELAYKKATERQKWLDLFIEYARATFKHRRVEFSTHSGIKAIIAKWKKTNTYITQYKKKFIAEGGKWKIIYWFTAQQWKQICSIEYESDSEIKQQLLEYAMLPNAKELITQLLLALEIPLFTTTNEATLHYIKFYLENYEAGLYGNCEAC